MDAPVPPTSHNPLQPSPVQSRPNSYAFEAKRPEHATNGQMRPSKSLGDKLIDIDDDRIQPQRAPPPQSAPPPSSSSAPSSTAGSPKKNKVKLDV
jgi:hypothetical protein